MKDEKAARKSCQPIGIQEAPSPYILPCVSLQTEGIFCPFLKNEVFLNIKKI
jgi:hypothetical protein